jgi:nitroreductase
MKKGSTIRKPDYPIDKIFLDRWSPRAMSGEPISDEELFPLFEAARWAPSSSNLQPWRFIYAKRDTPNWNKFFNLLVEFNQMWCKNAAALVCLISKKINKDGKLDRNHMSDAGAAWENLALQASLKNLVCHGMGGYDIELARKNLKVPKDYEIIHMFAIGKPGEISVLHERMQKSENPSERNPVKDFIFEGEFKE